MTELPLDPLDWETFAVLVGRVELPQPEPIQVIGLDEEFVGYAGQIHAVVPFSVHARSGPVTLGVRVSFQACDEMLCHPQRVAQIGLPLEADELIRN